MRSGALPSLKSTMAEAPASIAFWTFTTKSHVPRCMSAIAPVGKPAKSATSQPLVEPPVLGIRRSTAYSGAVTSPESSGARLPGVVNWNPDAYDVPPTSARTGAVRLPVYV
jgi:hypothetical protein